MPDEYLDLQLIRLFQGRFSVAELREQPLTDMLPLLTCLDVEAQVRNTR